MIIDLRSNEAIHQCETIEERDNEAHKMERVWCCSFGLSDLKGATPPAELLQVFEANRNRLNSLVELIRSVNAIPVIVIPPMTRIMLNLFSDEFLEVFMYSNIRETVADDVLLLDYLHDERFIGEYSFFYDSEFLNEKGAAEFTRVVVSDLETNGLLTPGSSQEESK